MIAPTPSCPVHLARRCFPAVLIALPLVYLAVDFIQFPVILNGCRTRNDEITLQEIVDKGDILKGSYLGHDFYVSLDAVEDSGYLNFIKGGPTALVIGIDHTNASEVSLGPLTLAVLGKLENLSPTDAAGLKKVVGGSDPGPRQVYTQRLYIPHQDIPNFPVDYLYVIGAKFQGSGDPQAKKEQAEILQSGLRAAMGKAGRDQIFNLIVPCVGVDPRDPTTLQYWEWFPQLFAAIEPSRRPVRIYLSVYKSLGDIYRLSALTSLHDAWAEACGTSRKQSALVREELRLILVGAFICLLVSSLHVAMTLKNFLIISAAFAGLGFGLLRSLHPFIQDWDADYRLFAASVGVIFLAVAFPYIPRWNPRELFDSKDSRNG